MHLVSISLYLLFTTLLYLSIILQQLEFQIQATDAGISATQETNAQPLINTFMQWYSTQH